MAYSPRLTEPSRSNKYYYSDNVFYSSGYGLPNCTCYAWGRFYEISGQRPKLCTGNAGTWYSYTSDGYQRGSKPKLGAVICWSRPGDAGHVAVVEKINSDGSIVTSNSAWGGTYFYTQTLYPPSYSWSSAYIFQGFIYNPSYAGGSGDTENVLSKFLQELKSHIGENGDWVWSKSGLSRGQHWCAAYIVACAKSVPGLLNVVIPNTFGAGEIARTGVRKNMGQWFRGPHHGSFPTPKPGDIISFRYNKKSNVDEYYADHVGAVIEASGTSLQAAEGNTGTYDPYTSKVAIRTYSTSLLSINGYFRPNWDKVGGSYSGLDNFMIGQPLYDITNTREDATIREVSYINSQCKPSITTSNIRLSVINYTTALGTIFNSLGLSSSGVASGNVDFSGVGNKNAAIIGEYLISKGFNAAMAVGFLANIFHESGYSTSAVNSSSGASGICQWLGGRKSAMIRTAGSDWKTNLTGQLDYLWIELNGSESGTLNSLKSAITANTEAMAMKAAEIVLKEFERPGDYAVNTPIRTNTAKKLWSKIVVNTASSTTGVNTGNAVADQVWNYLTNKGFSDSVAAGILGNMMRECGGDTLNLDWDIYGEYLGDRYYGLCQWALKYAPAVAGKSISGQLDYLMGTIENEFKVFGSNYASGFNYTKFKQLTSYSEAAAAFAACYERCGYENNYKLRRQNAKIAYDTYHK